MRPTKKTYYCASVEIYAYGAVKPAVITRECKAIPKNQARKPCGMAASMDWFETREEAEAFLAARGAA